MGAPEVLHRLQAEGYRLAADAGKLIVTPASKLTDETRGLIRAHRDGLLSIIGSDATPRPQDGSGRAANDDAAPSPCPASIEAARLARMARQGWPEDKALATAERLARRDADEDDRRMCIECTHVGDTGRCVAAALGRVIGADRRLEPVQDLLQRCEAFGLRKGLT
jgi:hypothetical protein